MSAAERSALAHAEIRPDATRRRELVWQDPVPTAAAGLTMPGLEYLRAVRDGELPPPPIGVTLGMSPEELEPGRVVFTGEPGEHLYNPIGTVHGGFAATLLDSALGCAVHTTLEAGTGYGTVDLGVTFLRPITRDTGPVRCEAEVVHAGRRIATAHGRVETADGRLLATGTGTFALHRPS